MEKIWKTIRFNIWLIGGIIGRYYKTILFTFISGLIVVVLLVKAAPTLYHLVNRDRKMIGVVGLYTPSDLPLGIQRLISSGLTDISDSGQPVPAVSTSWDESADGRTYIFHLRKDLLWHDGKTFTANDVNYNLRDVTFSASDAATLVVKMKDSFTPLPTFLSKPLFKKGLIGIGPYRLASIRLNGEFVNYLRLTGLSPDLPEIEVKFYATETTAKTAFKLGEVNVLDEVNDASTFQDWKTVKITTNEKFNQFVAIFFNLNDPVVKDKEIRQGLAYAIVKPEKTRVLTPLSPKSWAYTTQVKPYDQDIDQAKKLLGNVSSDSAALTLSTFPQYYNLAQQIAKEWNSVGMKTKIRVENGVPNSYQALLAPQETPPDPDQYVFWHSTQTQTNITHYSNPKIDKLLEDGRREIDQDKRKKLYFDFQRYLVDDVPAVFLFYPSTYTVSRI